VTSAAGPAALEEALGTELLVAVVVGSGIAAHRLPRTTSACSSPTPPCDRARTRRAAARRGRPAVLFVCVHNAGRSQTEMRQ